MFRKGSPARSALPYVFSDILAVIVSYYLAILARFHAGWVEWLFTQIKAVLQAPDASPANLELVQFYLHGGPRIIFLLCVTLIGLYAYLDLYAGRRLIRRRYAGWNMVAANLTALLLFYGYFYLRLNQFHPRSFFATVLFLNIAFGLFGRMLTTRLLQRLRWNDCPAILIDATREADVIERFITLQEPYGIRVLRRLGWKPGQPVEALRPAIEEAVRQGGAAMVICADKSLTVAQIMYLLELCGELNVEAKILSDKMNVLINEARIPADFFLDSPLIHFARPPVSALCLDSRHAAGVVLAILILAFMAPVMLLVALLIKLTSPGPVFFVQERIGIDRKPFPMYKFRTMHNRAEELQAQIEEFNESGEGLFKIRRDPRVTPIGRVLRWFSLDELPQLFNVLRGDMAMVGPRPLPRRDFESYYEEWHYRRHEGMPGLTCLWQVSGRSDISFQNMCILDVYYLRNQNAILDLKIVLRTVGVVLFSKGAY
jgi:exopolysaccharide biosynthesis polyprenyl glycosylphosphotransferase